jgi:hypothetical protein
VDIGRSAPYNWAHLSEAAFYRDMGTLMTGLMQRIPNSRDSGLIIESTANGMGGDFYDLCQRAMDPRRAGGWEFVFFGWWEHPEYRRTPEPGFKLTRDELAELQKYNLQVDQIAWRRWQIETACEGKIERFRQEQPGNPQEAFQSSGRTIFDMQAVARMPEIRGAPRGRLEVIEAGLEKRVQFRQSEDGRGELVVYHKQLRQFIAFGSLKTVMWHVRDSREAAIRRPLHHRRGSCGGYRPERAAGRRKLGPGLLLRDRIGCGHRRGSSQAQGAL